MKFMVDEVGPEQYRERVEERLGYRLADGAVPEAPEREYDHSGVHAQKQPGLCYAGFPVYLGLCNGEQMVQIAGVAESVGGEIRLTRRQNFILANIPEARVEDVVAAIAQIGFPLDVNPLRELAIACTGEPFCNYAVSETKSKLAEIVEHLEQVFGDQVAGLRLNLDGCPHSCAHHWIGDIGLQGTTSRDAVPRVSGTRPLTSTCAAGWAGTRRSAVPSYGACRARRRTCMSNAWCGVTSTGGRMAKVCRRSLPA